MLDDDKWYVCGKMDKLRACWENRLYFCVRHPKIFSKKTKNEKIKHSIVLEMCVLRRGDNDD